MYDGYLQLAGTEIINAQRTAAYVENQIPEFPLDNCVECDTLINALEDKPYTSPALDDAPWYDVSQPATADFYGMYPLGVQGDQDSTRAADVTEGILAGGFIGAAREATRPMRVHGLMIAKNALGLDAGMTWLRNALNAASCDGGCTGGDLCYYAACPNVLIECYYPRQAGVAVQQDIPLGSLTPASSPLIYRFGQDPDDFDRGGCAWVDLNWVFDRADGQVGYWGAMDTDSSNLQSQSVTTYFQRHNVVNDSSFHYGNALADWVLTPTPADFSVQPSGGSDGDAYARVATVGANMLNYTPFWTFEASTATLSIYLRSATNATVTVEVISADGVTSYASVVAPLNAAWARYSVVTPVTSNVRFRLTSTGAYDLDEIMFEDGAVLLPYFDGETPDDGLYQSSWQTGGRGSVRVWIGVPSTNRDDSEFRPYFTLTQGSIAFMTLELTHAVRVPIDEQVEPYSRVFREVTATAGPTVLAKFDLDCGVMYEIEYYLTAGTPFAFSMPVPVDTSDLPFADYDDRGPILFTNLIDNPSGKVNTTNYVAANGTAATAVGVETVLTATSAVATGLAKLDLDTTAIGLGAAQLKPLTTYLLSAYIMGDVVAPRLVVSGTGLAAPVAISGGVGAYGRSTVIFTTLASGNVTFTLANNAAIAIGNKLKFYNAMVVQGVSVPDYFDGSTTSDVYNYEWLGTINNSASTERIANACAWNPPAAIVDPDCPPIPPAPRPPVIDDTCIEDAFEWVRQWVTIPRERVSSWSQSLPILRITSKEDEVRQLRVRMYPNPFNYAPEVVDPCSWCAEFIVSYIPAFTELTVDGPIERAFASVAGAGQQAADHLLYGSDGGPMTWPALSCGIPYVMTIDTLPTVDPDYVSIELELARRE